jgi:uncharacterized protein (DUF58 family)
MLLSRTGLPATSLSDLIPPDLAARLDRLDVLSRRVFAGKLPGERRSKRRGRSVEFDDYRNYTPGDDLRHIDWNVFARLDKLFIKLFREEEDLAVHILLDASPSMSAGEPGKLAFAQRMAMALAYIGLVNQNRVVLSILGAPGRRPLQRLTPIRGRRQLERAARFIIDGAREPRADEDDLPLAARGEVSLVDGLKQIALSRVGSGVMVILSDFLYREDLGKGLNYLAAGRDGGFDVYCLQILSPGELDPTLERERGLVGDLRLTDVETGRSAEITLSSALIKRYKARVDAHCEKIRTLCAARRMSHNVVRSDADVNELLTGYLRRRGLVG